MAKIGNEARLILKLAEERVKREKDEARRIADASDSSSQDHIFYGGKFRGVELYENTLTEIVLEIEGR